MRLTAVAQRSRPLAALRQINRGSGSSASVPPPVKGWNTILPLAAMPQDWAVQLDNWFPQPGYIELRRGHVLQCNTGHVGPVETIMAYHGDTAGEDRKFAAVGAFIVDTTTATPSNVVTGLTSARWQYVNFTTTGGQFLFACNGADAARHYNGSVWATPVITGISSDDIVHVVAHKRRLWFVLNNSTKAAYLNVDSIAGPATTFEFGNLFTKGGYLVAMETWTVDAGWGPDDMLVAISSKGQVAIYAGTDPNSATDWVIKGVFDIGEPIGRRCLTKVGSDVAVICMDGVLPLSMTPGVERGAAVKIALTANIQPTMNASARNWNSNFGWQLISYPRGTMALLNVPDIEGVSQQQYVMNTVTGAWCRFLGQNANCWELFQDRLFFGGNDGIVYEADMGSTDAGQPITWDMKQAFNYFGSKGRLKRWTFCRPNLSRSFNVNTGVALNVDFNDDAESAVSPSIGDALALWDVAEWDVDIWPTTETTQLDWLSVVGIGFCSSLRLNGSINSPSEVILRLNGVDYIYEIGGVI